MCDRLQQHCPAGTEKAGVLARDNVNIEFCDEPLLFDHRVDPEIDRRLRKAVATRRTSPFETERLLWIAQREDPSCLQIYFALYKFYSHGRRLNDASRALRLAITEAARQGGFHCDWEKLDASDLNSTHEGLFYLFSLKALAFIRLRQQRMAEALAILDHLQRLDKDDRSGTSVVRALADSLDLADHEHAH